jgi:phospho-N-acetylmuramoyl-pentapeptide-transferase
MFYHLFTWFDAQFDFPGAGVFQYLTFRASMAVLFSLLISFIIGQKLIRYLRKKQISDEIRDLGLKGQSEKKNTPTMGGIIIIMAIILPTLLFADLTNIYIILILISTIWLGVLGFIDDYIKVFRKNKSGLAGHFKIIGQIILGIGISVTLAFHPDVVIRETIPAESISNNQKVLSSNGKAKVVFNQKEDIYQIEHRSTKTTIPFIKQNEFDYAKILSFLGPNHKKWAFLIYIPIIIFLIVAVSNGANLTDGLDGLNAGVSAIVVLTLAIFAYLSGNSIFSDYLNIMYIPNLGEMVIFTAAMIGASIGFLWFNAFPAQIFMGDTGSLTYGGLIAIIAVMVRKELLLPVLCGIFFIESLSVILQVAYFKYTKRKYGAGKRIFRMSPLHHHYQKKDYPEPKIVVRFWIIGIALAIISIVTLKLR